MRIDDAEPAEAPKVAALALSVTEAMASTAGRKRRGGAVQEQNPTAKYLVQGNARVVVAEVVVGMTIRYEYNIPI